MRTHQTAKFQTFEFSILSILNFDKLLLLKVYKFSKICTIIRCYTLTQVYNRGVQSTEELQRFTEELCLIALKIDAKFEDSKK